MKHLKTIPLNLGVLFMIKKKLISTLSRYLTVSTNKEFKKFTSLN